MICEELWAGFQSEVLDFFTGVPDSTFAPWLSFLADRHGQGLVHLVAANEGEAVGLAAGHHLATGKVGVVYMQNAGLGNAVNPLTSLADREVYAIPMILMIGWRGEPGRHDEPQHIKMGRVMLPLLEALEIPHRLLPPDAAGAAGVLRDLHTLARQTGAPVALIVRSGVVAPYRPRAGSEDAPPLAREEALGLLLEILPPDVALVSTTGKTSRELFEWRERRGENHARDFLTVGSMGFSPAIALGLAMGRPERRFVVLDGDGALLMHAGSLATIGHYAPSNLYHILLDNRSYDSTGGQATVSASVDFEALARACRYRSARRVSSADELRAAARAMMVEAGPTLLVVRVRPGARADLGRPTTSPTQNKEAFMNFVQSDEGADP